MSARFNADSGRYEYAGASSESLRDDGMLDALRERARCEWCHTALDRPDPAFDRHIGDDTWHYCDDDCRMASFQDWTR